MSIFNDIDYIIEKETPQLVVFMGPSAAGKDSVMRNYCKERGYSIIINSTTRPKRPEEKDKIDYYFYSIDEFKRNLTSMLAIRTFNTIENGKPSKWYYGVNTSQIKQELAPQFIILDYEGFKEINNYYSAIGIYISADEQIRKQRAQSRGGFEEKEWNRRLEDDRRVFNEAILDDRVKVIYNNEENSNLI